MLSCTDPAVTTVEADAYALPPQRALDLHRRNRGYPDGQLAWQHNRPLVVVMHHASHPGKLLEIALVLWSGV